MLGFVWDFIKLHLFVNWWKLIWIYDLDVFCDEINNDLFNEFILYFINFIVEFNVFVNI